MCISLIQEQVARQAALAAGTKDEVIELDVIEIVPRQKDFFGTKGEPIVDAVVVPNVDSDDLPLDEDTPETTGALPGETIDNGEAENDDDEEDKDEEDEDDEDEGDDESEEVEDEEDEDEEEEEEAEEEEEEEEEEE